MDLGGICTLRETYVKVELVNPAANDFVLSGFVIYLVLEDIVTTWGISILIELHWIASCDWR